MMAKHGLVLSCLVIVFSGGWLRADLAEYIAKPDPSYAWELRGKADVGTATLYELRLTSQTWQDIPWQHNLNLFVPKTSVAAGFGVLLIDGGNQSALDRKIGADAILYGSMLASRIGVPCAVLRQVPNQPLFGNLREDALIAKSFRRYVETGDESWPLLFPMAKSAVRAMDTLGEFSQKELGGKLEKFVVTGASKRGWTTWLTAASDPRVIALGPMVIDMLNSRPQMDHQKKVFGGWSAQTGDYHSLLQQPENDKIRRLWRIVDPFALREKITQPKLVILGNNDPYWATDALNLYWDGLSGPKWIHYVPNAGHDLSPKFAGQRLPPTRALETFGVFARHQITGERLPTLDWKHDDGDGRPRVTVKATPAPKGAVIWVAEAPTHDFRAAAWNQQPARIDGTTVTGSIGIPATGSAAFYADLEYEYQGVSYHLCTQLRIVDAPVAAGK